MSLEAVEQNFKDPEDWVDWVIKHLVHAPHSPSLGREDSALIGLIKKKKKFPSLPSCIPSTTDCETALGLRFPAARLGFRQTHPPVPLVFFFRGLAPSASRLLRLRRTLSAGSGSN